MKLKFKTILFLSLGILVLSNCKKKEAESDDEETETIGSIETESGSGAKGVSIKLAEVEENMLPGSLVVDGSALALEGNPCEDSDGFFDCQPVLIKMYLKLAKDVVGSVAATVKATSALTNELAVGSSGTIKPTKDDIESIQYKVDTANFYTLILSTESGEFVRLSVDESGSIKKYIAHFDGANSPDGDGQGVSEVIIDYTSANDFDVSVIYSGMECSDDDVRAPEKIKLVINKNKEVWQGKAMIYQPRFISEDSDTCDLDVSDETEMYMYTDFVGNDDNTTASLYMMQPSVDDVRDFSDWNASDFCTNFPGSCSGGYGFGDPNPVSTYTNAFCVAEDSTTWGEECDDFSTSDYSATGLWDVPSEFGDIEAEFPSSIDMITL